MDPFHVTCETCRARLKISSESVIGEIHACPKCESMVHILPPPGWVASSTAVAEAVAATEMEVPPTKVGSPLVVWSIGSAAIVLVAAGLAALVWTAGQEPVGAPTVAAVAPSDETTATPDPAAEAPIVNPPVDENVEEATEDQVAQSPLNEATDEGPIEPVADSPAPRDMPVEEVAVVAESAESSASPAPPPAAAADRRPVLKFDPLDFDPAQLSLGGATLPPPTETSGSVANPSAEPAVVVAEDDRAPGQEPGEAAIGDPSIAVRLGPEATDVSRPRDVAEQLALKVDSLELPPMPLARFADIASEIGNVAITVDPAALAMAGLSPRATVAVQGRNTTLDKLLRDSLTKLRLDFVERDGQVVIVHPNRDVRRGVDYEVKDLLEAGAKDATAMSEMIQRFVVPDSWRGGATGGTIRVDGTKLHVEHTNRVQIQILMFCERLRLARGLAPRSRYPAERLSIDSPYVKLSATLSKPTTFTFLPWTRLADVARHWQESTGVTILVNWEALATEELAPGTPIACSAINRPWDAAFDAVLEPLGLAWWAVDGETIQITSRTALGQMERIEFYPVPKDQADGADVKIDGAAHVVVDAPSGRLIVLGSPEVHRNLTRRLSGATMQ